MARAFPEFENDLANLPLDVAVSERDDTDYQFNGAMLVFNKCKNQAGFTPKTPNETAKAIVGHVDLDQISWLVKSVQVVPNMFYINVILSPDFLSSAICETGKILPGKARLRPPLVAQRERVLVDFSSPNIAKVGLFFVFFVYFFKSSFCNNNLCWCWGGVGNARWTSSLHHHRRHSGALNGVSWSRGYFFVPRVR